VGAVIGENWSKRIQIFSVLARLKPGVTPAQASAEATSRARSAPDPGLAAVAMFGSRTPPDVSATPAVEAMTAEIRPAVLVLLVAVLLLLVAATANIGGLQLARSTARHREIAVRAALGAGGGRLARQLIVESGLVGAMGAGSGVALAWALIRVAPSLLPPDFPRAGDIVIDLRVLGFALAASTAATIGCGILPALQARRLDLVEALAQDSGSTVAGVWRARSGRVRSSVMVAQVAIACVLLVGAALLVRSFAALMHADRGYDPAGVLTARVNVPQGYSVNVTAFADALLERLSAAPGVQRAAVSTALPLLTSGASAFAMRSPRDPSIEQQVQTLIRVVSPEFFDVFRLRVVLGRRLTRDDTASSPAAIVVNRSFAARYLGEGPIGARVPISFGDGRPEGTVVGMVDDMRQGAVTDPQAPEVFVSYRQMPDRMAGTPLVTLLRTVGDPAAQVPTLRAAVRDLDPSLAIDSIMTMDERVATSLARPRTYAGLMSMFALFAIAIAGVGLFGVLSYGVAQRSREIGVRTALGARRGHIVALVLRQAIAIAAVGILLGCALALAATRYLAAFLYGVGAHDPLTFAGVAAALLAVSAMAGVVPARRAASVDPLDVLRN